jgi:molybdopterin synthase catalytic subunit
MRINVQITHSPIALEREPMPVSDSGIGAVAEFTGIVRGMEAGEAIAALEYQAYEPMASKVMVRLLEELAKKHPCHSADVIHRAGIIPVGEAAIFIRVRAEHRSEAFALLTTFIDRLKADVPIWKIHAIKVSKGKAVNA